jgi:branched-chain amino acid transport system ATP-binding protein
LVPEGVQGIFPTLTVRQNLAIGGDAGHPELGGALRDAFGEVLVDRMDQIAGSMSGGQRQMLAISIALSRRPAVLLLDEPSTGLAPVIVERIFATVAELAPRLGTAVLIVEQDVASALAVSDRIAVLQSGTVVAEFSRAECPPPTELWRFF